MDPDVTTDRMEAAIEKFVQATVERKIPESRQIELLLAFIDANGSARAFEQFATEVNEGSVH